MTSLRSSRSLSNLQVNSLRFNQQDLPAGGGILAVGPTGAAIITTDITLTSIDVSNIVITNLSAGTIDVSGLTAASITVSSLAATAADISGLTAVSLLANTIDVVDLSAGTIDVTDLSADTITVSNLTAATIDASGLSVSDIIVSGLTATTINVVDLSADTITATGITAGTAIFTGDITAQDVNVLGTIQALDVSARYFDISGIRVGEDVDVSGTFRVEQLSTFVGPVTFLNTIDASGQTATFGSVIVQTDLSAASLYVSGGTTVQNLSAATLTVSGPATFDTATMDTLTVRDIYIQNQIVDVSLGQITQLLIDDILAGSGGATTHAFAAGYPLDVSGGLRVGDFGGTYLRVTPGTTGWTTLEPLGTVDAGVAVAGNFSASVITADGISAQGITAGTVNVTGGFTADLVTATGVSVSGGITAGSIYASGSITTTGSLYAYDVSARYLDISGLRTNQNVDVSGSLTVEQGSLLKGGVTMQSTLDVSGSAVGRSGLRVLTPASMEASVGTTLSAGYIDTNALRIFTDESTGITLGQLQLQQGTTFPNGAALVWNNSGLGDSDGNAQLVIGTGNGGDGKFNVYTGVTQQPVPIGILPQMSLDAAGNLTVIGQLNANTAAVTGSITGGSANIINQINAGSAAIEYTLSAGTGNFTIDAAGNLKNITVRTGADILNGNSTTSSLILNNANGGNGSPQTLTVSMSGANGFLSDAIINTTNAGAADVPDIIFQTGGTERMRIGASTGLVNVVNQINAGSAAIQNSLGVGALVGGFSSFQVDVSGNVITNGNLLVNGRLFNNVPRTVFRGYKLVNAVQEYVWPITTGNLPSGMYHMTAICEDFKGTRYSTRTLLVSNKSENDWSNNLQIITLNSQDSNVVFYMRASTINTYDAVLTPQAVVSPLTVNGTYHLTITFMSPLSDLQLWNNALQDNTAPPQY